MTDKQWYTQVEKAYAAKAAELIAAGYTCQNQGERFIEHFTKGSERVQIVRQLGSPNWYTTPYSQPEKIETAQ